MEFLIPLPDHPYYLWQMLVQTTHLREMGYEENTHYLVVYFDGAPTEQLRTFFESDDLRCYLHAYPDTREDRSYGPSMKPWLLAQFFDQFPEEGRKAFNYLDPDVLFTRPMDFSPFERENGCWYGSDTGSYTSASYIRSKGEQLFLDLCLIAEVDPDLVLAHDHNSIGAQYFIKQTDAEFWRHVERTSVAAHRHMVETAEQYHPEGHEHPIQAWCAEMYMQQFATVRAGITPIASPLMDFHWADAPADKWAEKAYFHNAGQTAENGGHFSKTTWQVSPFGKDIQVSSTSASSRYVELIRRTEDIFPDLIWE
ncbi:hypothetical protein [Propioniciclava sinopodophylli]|uniref:hypothetical protein n=1 Tax=Propioniciclava sinopodophylli TaxID=1837344 RepID=UPI0013F1564F|nr:hypothetical protein [Propioniciclava sinopodophylli]